MFSLGWLSPLILNAQPNLDFVDKAVDSIINSVQKLSNNEDKIKILNSKAGEYRYKKTTLKLLHKALSISKKINNNQLIATCYYSLGNFYFYNTRLDSAMVYLNKSNDYIKTIEAPSLKASISNKLLSLHPIL